jgi:hypothetical protein
MAENLFEIRKNDRRKQIIDDNIDVADQILATNPLFKSEDIIEDIIKEKENSEDSIEKSDKLTPINLSDFKKKEIDKGRYTYYLDAEIDKLLIIVSKKFEMKSKSILANLLLGTALLMNEDIQSLSENNKDVKKYYSKLFDKFKEN